MTEKVYSRVTEAEEMIKALCEKQPKLLWRVRSENVQVWGVENKERSESNKTLAVIKVIKGVEKAILQDANLPVRYYINLYWSDWREWKENKRQGIIIHELLHIHEETGKLIKHDVEDFGILLDKASAKPDRYDTFPNVLLSDVEFDLSLLPKTEEADEEENDEINEEIEKKKRGRPKKETKEEAKETKEDVKEDKKEETKEEDPDADVFQ